MSEYYRSFHKTKIETAKNNDDEFTDLITFEPAHVGEEYNKFLTVSYLRIDKLNRPIKIYYWKLESAKLWILDNNKKFDPENRMQIIASFPERIKLQLELTTHFNINYKPSIEHLVSLFNKYITKQPLTPAELCEMKVFLHMDDSGFMSDWMDVIGLDIRTKALESINASANGSWLLRTGSITDSNIIKARVITLKNNEGTIIHIPIAYVYSFGYIKLDVIRGATMPDEGITGVFPKYTGKIYTSFIDCLENLATIYNFDISKIIHN